MDFFFTWLNIDLFSTVSWTNEWRTVTIPFLTKPPILFPPSLFRTNSKANSIKINPQCIRPHITVISGCDPASRTDLWRYLDPVKSLGSFQAHSKAGESVSRTSIADLDPSWAPKCDYILLLGIWSLLYWPCCNSTLVEASRGWKLRYVFFSQELYPSSTSENVLS